LGGGDALDVIHAWLFEDLPGGRVRILTQESQKGVPALIRINGHQRAGEIGSRLCRMAAAPYPAYGFRTRHL
jgi:hypothetical protein